MSAGSPVRVINTQSSTQSFVGSTDEQMRQQWQQWQQYQMRQEQQMRFMQQQMDTLTKLVTQSKLGEIGGSSREATRTAADTLPMPPSALKAATRRTARRVTYPQPDTTPFSTPHKPTSAATRADEGSTETDEETDGERTTDSETETAAAAASAAGEKKKKKAVKLPLKDVLSMMRSAVEPFYADSSKDNGTTVLDFVENVETAMSDVISDQPEYKLVVVRRFLEEGALRWFNEKIKELQEASQEPISWEHDVRRDFIRAHTGIDTPELWLAKLGTLRLGKGKTKTPIELDSQFDSIARHIHPTATAGDKGVDFSLCTQYSSIIAASNKEMWKSILRSQPHASLKEWKKAVALQWNAETQIRARDDQDRLAYSQTEWRRGKGGRGGSTSGAFSPLVGVKAMDADDGAGVEDEDSTGEGQTDSATLNAAAGNRQAQRGGRGGRGGRGRGGSTQRTPWTEEKKRLYDEQLCFNCKEGGHKASDCPKPRQLQSNQRADQ